MKIIKIFSDYCSSIDIVRHYFLMDELYFDPSYNHSYRFTINDDYTHAIIINKATPILTIPKENVIGLAHEPPEFLDLTFEQFDQNFVNYVQQHVSKYYIGEKYNLPEEFIEYNGFVGHMPLPRIIINKTKIMSLMISNKVCTTGHRYRHMIANIILQNNLPIDIYGRGCNMYEPNSLLKGTFNENEHIENYLFHITIENTQHPHYFTEKIINPLLMETNVIYLGCTNILHYFPDNGIHQLNGNIQHDMDLIIDILNNWQKYYKRTQSTDVSKKISIKNAINNFD